MLHAKSPSAYRLAEKILVLPSTRTLRNEKMKSLNRCQIGIQDGVASRISRAIDSSENYYDHFAVICFDEMTIKGNLAIPEILCKWDIINFNAFIFSFAEDLVFQSSSGNVIGFVNYGNDDINSFSSVSDNVASHMLAVFVRGKCV